MYIIDSKDNIAAQEIMEMQIKRNDLYALAQDKEKVDKYSEALSLYYLARRLSIYVAKGLKARVCNEEADFISWHIIDHKIKRLEKLNFN